MKKILFYFIISLAVISNSYAHVYYVSNDGKNSNNGLSKEAPLQTLEAAAQKVSPGDAILLKRGDIFRESVEITAPDVEVNAYGAQNDPLPVISGAVQLTGFKPFRDNIYVAETDAEPGYLFAGGELMLIARYPNEGWLRTRYWEDKKVPNDASAEVLNRPNTMIECPELADYPENKEDFWVGANIKWRHHSWWFETRPVVDYDPSGKLYLGDRSFSVKHHSRRVENGWGFYLDNKLELLDAPGEWYFDTEQGRVYFYPPEGKNPDNLLIEGSVRSLGLKITNGVVQNIRFEHQQDIGLEIDGISVVQYCEFEGIGRDAKVSEQAAGGAALRAEQHTQKTRISHNTFENNFNKAIDWWQNPEDTTASVIERNIVNNTGVVDGYGGSGSWHAVAILIGRGRNVHVQYNRIDKAGYVGILFGSEGNHAEYNVINNAMYTLNDGGGIYTNCSRSTIRYNIILNTRGGMESSGSWANIEHGIWPEFLREYRESIIEYNTIVNSGGDGIFLPNNYDCVVRNNICYDNDRFQLLMIGHEKRGQLNVNHNHLITGNILYAAEASQNTLYFDDRNDYGVLKDNYFLKPSSGELIHEGKNWPGMGSHNHFTLEEWQNEFDWADSSPQTGFWKTSGSENIVSEIFINDSEEVKTIQLNGKWLNIDGEPVNGSIVLKPYTSKILIKDE
ncbi:MAG: right-handed parallel beta-helix repeat-containing protein [Prolixibacteraceae bacterium]